MNFMEKVGVWIFVFIFLSGFVCAAWGDIGREEGGVSVIPNDSVTVPFGDDSFASNEDNNFVTNPSNSRVSSNSKFFYTHNFYIALGIGVIGLLVIALFLYLFFRSPKNKWKS